MAICQAANPQFPQLCGCAIGRSQAEGIDGAALDKLLANDFMGVPLDAMQRYGLIFVECTQAAVMQQLSPGMAMPGVPGPPPVAGVPGAPPVAGIPEAPPVASLPGQAPSVATSPEAAGPSRHAAPAPVEAQPGAPSFAPPPLTAVTPLAPLPPMPGAVAAAPVPVPSGPGSMRIDLDPLTTAGTAINLDPSTSGTGAAIDLDSPVASAPMIDLDPPAANAGSAIDLDPQTSSTGAVIDLDPPVGTSPVIDLDASTGTTQTIDLDPAPRAPPATGGFRLVVQDGTQMPPPGSWFAYAELIRNDPFPAWADRIIGGSGVTDERGTILMAACNARSAPALVVGPLRDPAALYAITLEVRGAGGILHEQTVPARWIEQDLGHAEFRTGLMNALRRGSSVIVRLKDAGGTVTDTLTFGLRGSSDALPGFDCANKQPWLSTTPGGFGGEWVRGAWMPTERWDDDPRGAPALTLGQPNTVLERLTLTCDRRFVLDPAGKYVPPPGFEASLAFTLALSVDGGPETELPARFASSFSTELVTVDPLPASLLAAMATGQRLMVGRPDMEPGDMLTRSFDLAGLAAGLGGLACPPPPEAPAARPRTDLTGLGLLWQAGDIGESLPRDFNGNVQPTPVAWLDLQRTDLPNLGLYCGGYPYFLGGDFPVRGDATLRLTVDGDPTLSEDVAFGSYRAFMNGSPDPALAQAILSGRTLRVTLLEDSRIDVLYPLDGAAATLRAAGCAG